MWRFGPQLRVPSLAGRGMQTWSAHPLILWPASSACRVLSGPIAMLRCGLAAGALQGRSRWRDAPCAGNVVPRGGEVPGTWGIGW